MTTAELLVSVLALDNRSIDTEKYRKLNQDNKRKLMPYLLWHGREACVSPRGKTLLETPAPLKRVGEPE